MNTLIIPCAGRKVTKKIPLYLECHPEGMLIVKKAIDGIDLACIDRVIVTILKEDNIKYNAETRIKNAFSPVNVDICVLDFATRDVSETVYETIKKCKVHGSIIIKDADNMIAINEIMKGNFIAGLNLSEYGKDIHNLKSKSFVSINDNNQILDVIEKQICSENIGVGLYGFLDATDFLFAYERLCDKFYPLEHLFISHMISYLIGYKGLIFHYIKAENFEDWGNEKAWIEIKNRYSTYFLDLDSIFGDSLDYNNGKDVIYAMKELSKQGAYFVGFTSQGENVKDKTKQLFSKMEINCLQIVYGCSKSPKKRILSNPQEIYESLYFFKN